MRRALFVLVLVLGGALVLGGGRGSGWGSGSSTKAKPLPAALTAPDVLAWTASRTHVVLARAEGVTVLDLVSGAELRLPGILAAKDELRFSPRGDRLAISLRVGSKADVYLLDLAPEDGPRLHRLTLAGGGDPRWLGNGERLLYQAPDGRGGVSLFVRDERGIGPAEPFWDERPQTSEAASIS